MLLLFTVLLVIAFYYLPFSWKRRILAPIAKGILSVSSGGLPKESGTVLSNNGLRNLTSNLWIVAGTLPQPGPKFTRTMTIVLLSDGTLLLHSPIRVSDSLFNEIKSLGKSISVVIIPNSFHRLDASYYRKLLPQAQFIAPRASLPDVLPLIPDCKSCESVLESFKDVTCIRPGNETIELVYRVVLDGGPDSALLFTDLFWNLDPERADGVSRFLGSANGFGSTLLGDLLMSDVGTFLNWLDQLLGVPDTSVIVVAHGDPVVGKTEVINALKTAKKRIRE